MTTSSFSRSRVLPETASALLSPQAMPAQPPLFDGYRDVAHVFTDDSSGASGHFAQLRGHWANRAFRPQTETENEADD
jgi:hypothetical protein